MRVDALQLVPVLKTLVDIDWIAELAERTPDDDPRYVLLVDPAVTPLAPLVSLLLLPRDQALANVWQKGSFDTLRLGDVL